MDDRDCGFDCDADSVGLNDEECRAYWEARLERSTGEEAAWCARVLEHYR